MRPASWRALGTGALIVVSMSGCASAWRSGATGLGMAPNGLPWGEEYLRRSFALGAYEQALASTAPKATGAPSDPLLRALFRGQAAYYAGSWGESARAFAEADRLLEQRATKSASRGVLSVVTGDQVLRYVPSRTEQLFARYYGMLGRLQADDVTGAAVEARRLSRLLEEVMHDVDPAERATHAALREAAGAVFEAAGEWNDAGVAYRNAALLRGVSRAAVDSIVVQRPAADSATLVLLVEQGFAAHYVERTLAIPLDETGVAAARRAPSRRASASPAPSNRLWDGLSRAGRAAGASAAAGNANGSRAAGGRVEPRTMPGEGAPSTTVEEIASEAADAAKANTRGGRSTGEHAALALARLDSVRDSVRSPRAAPLAARWLSALDALPEGGVFDLEAEDAEFDELPGLGAEEAMSSWRGRRNGVRYLGDRGWGGAWMEVRWPALVRSPLPRAPLAMRLDGVMRDSAGTGWQREMPLAPSALVAATVSDAIGADARRLRAARLARLTARTAIRVATVEAVREQHGEVASALVGMLVSAVDRADTRVWHTLPGALTVVRVTVPAGSVQPALLQGSGANRHALGGPTLTLLPGAVQVLPSRVWRDPDGMVVRPAVLGAHDRDMR
jgi:hypothetical protein